MSDSRLEKFIYAIYSMDVSDLPVPLSRIEKLCNCLITGETPDFEPLSRNEKYLMAMLDRYDISNLPAPMSRGEKLLYKIAVGETDLSDVPGYLSRYEELLKYLIENGGVLEKEVFNAISKNGDILVTKNGDNLIYNGRISGSDFECVLYTLNQSLYTLYSTAEKPIKSAILKGQTLINLVTQKSGSFNGTRFLRFPLSHTPKTNAKYFINFNVRESSLTDGVTCRFKNTSTGLTFGALKSSGIIATNTNVPDILEIYIDNTDDVTNGLDAIIDDIMVIEYQEGMENWDIPYFEGMQSVKMPVLTTTGKNLFDKEAFYNDWKGKQSNYIYKEIVDNEEVLKVNNFKDLFDDKDGFRINVKKGVPLTLRMECKKAGTHSTNSVFTIRYDDKKYLDFPLCHSDEWVASTITFVPTRDYITFCSGYNYDDYYYVKNNIQLEEGSVATSYELHKSNILSCNEEVTLRGIGEGSNRVEDELDLLTGELTQRVGEIVLNGSENWWISGSSRPNHLRLYSPDPRFKQNQNVINNRFADNGNPQGKDIEGIYITNTIDIQVEHSRLSDVSVDGFKMWLSENPITIQARLSEKSIKTVDLTVVDQDNQPTKLGTFENVTHVSLVAENLIPEVEMEVATRISEELASASPLMDDISTKQEQLNTKVDEQSENVDATMIATTEIFEEIL